MISNLVFEVRTAFYVLCLVSLLQALGTWAVLRHRSEARLLNASQRQWIWGSLAFAVLLGTIGVRTNAEATGNLLITHALTLLWLGLSWGSLRLDMGESPRWIYLPVLVVASLSLYAVLLRTLPTNRSLLYPVALVLVGGTAVAWRAYRLARREASRSAGFISAAFGMTLLVVLVRGITVGLQSDPNTPLSQEQGQIIIAICGISILMLSNLGFVGLQFERQARSRVEAEQLRARAEERHLQSQERERALEQLIDERDLLIRRLQRLDSAQQMAVVAASLPHELRQPLAALRINLDLLIDDQQRGRFDTAPELLARLDRDTQVLGTMINDLMAMMRRQPSDELLESVDLAPLIQQAMDVVASRARICGIELLRPQDASVVVHSNSAALRQVLLILLTNAIDVLADLDLPRQISVEVHAGEREVLLQVRDTGPGIPEHVRAHLFQPFATQRQDGSGIGLALAWRLSQRCAAQLSATASRPEAKRPGALFTLRLGRA